MIMRLELICSGLTELLVDNNYSQTTINFYKREWKKLNDFLLSEYGDDDFSIDKGLIFLEKIHGIVSSFEDDAVGYKNTMDLARAYSDNNVPFELHIFNRGKHGISLGDENVYKKSDCTLDRKIFGTWIDMLFNFLKVNNITINE